MAWRQQQKLMRGFVELLAMSEGKGQGWTSDWQGKASGEAKGKAKGKAYTGKGKGKGWEGKGKGEKSELWQPPWKLETPTKPKPIDLDADAEAQEPWICTKCCTSHNLPGGWTMRRCRHCRAPRHPKTNCEEDKDT